MTTAESRAAPTESRERIEEFFSRRLVPVAMKGLRSMLLDDGRVFCFKALPAGPGALSREGVSERYSAMVAVGVALQERYGVRAPFEMGRVWDHLFEWASASAEPGDAGLVLWAMTLARDARASDVADRIVRARDAILVGDRAFPSMEAGYLLIGLGEAMRGGVGGDAIRTLAADVAARLERSQHRATGLFSFTRAYLRKNLHRVRVDSKLGSFASQVYPTMGFGAYARASGDERAKAIAVRCADRLVTVQGEAGQWWWVYHPRSARPAIRYPVYSVHQEAMGPMALLAAALANGTPGRYDAAIGKSLDWLDRHPELPGTSMWDLERGVVWRALQRDDPAATSTLGLGEGELRRMGRAAWLGTPDDRPFEAGHLCAECRPYELGWILLADAMFRERCAGAPRPA